MQKKIHKKKGVKFLLIAIPVTLFTAVVVSFIGSKTTLDQNVIIKAIPLNKEATLSIGKVHQVSTKNGVKEWELVADSSQYYVKKQKVLFTNLKITFFTKNKKEYYLRADHGTFDTNNNNMTVSGNVIVTDEKKRKIKAKTLLYDKKRHILFSNTEVSLQDNLTMLNANSMEIKLNQDEILFIGNVRGKFSAKIKLN